MYVLWDVIGIYLFPIFPCSGNSKNSIDDTIARKVNSSDASAFAHICGCCPSQGMSSIVKIVIYFCKNLITAIVWGVLWLIIAFCFFAAGVIVGLVEFKVRMLSQNSKRYNI